MIEEWDRSEGIIFLIGSGTKGSCSRHIGAILKNCQFKSCVNQQNHEMPHNNSEIRASKKRTLGATVRKSANVTQLGVTASYVGASLSHCCLSLKTRS